MSGEGWERDLSERSAELGRLGAIAPAQAELLQRLAAQVGALTGRQVAVPQALVRSAVPLTDDERARLEAIVARRFPGMGPVSYEVDPELLGGIWLRVGDQIIDGSLRGRLEALRGHLT